ncbi:ABC transporter substrate-binding protein [Aquincola sp. S2]|uniref:ABC transporter substrate-binding protein n=1 Tax=Pseudaquabacterium terrae TaxID=2732868 RepID=A0ABX2EEF0_9BURK|nr:ABC transporter substrate-binding protein [Aquabacterium terrae]
MAIVLLAPVYGTSRAQRTRVIRIGILATPTPEAWEPRLVWFKQALASRGYVEGQDYVLVPRFANNNIDQLDSLAAELVRLKPDLIATIGAAPTKAVMNQTGTIPIVVIGAGDPVGSGLVKSLARPGGNVTGTSNSFTDLTPKTLQLLRDTVRDLSRIAVLVLPGQASHQQVVRTMHTLAPGIGIRVIPVEIPSARELEQGFRTMTHQGAQAVVVAHASIFLGLKRQLAELCLANRLAGASFAPEYADAGLLIGYGPDPVEFYNRTAYFIDRILKGASPADLPVEQPTKFEFALNLRTARALGISVPQALRLRADRIIE